MGAAAHRPIKYKMLDGPPASSSYDSKKDSVRAKAVSKRIDRNIRQEEKSRLGHQRFLVVGSHSSGKSTIINNLKTQYGKAQAALTGNCSTKQTNEQRNQVRYSMNAGLMQILRAMPVLSPPCPLENPSLQWRVDWLEANARSKRSDFTSIEYSNHIKHIWHDAGVRRCFERSNEYELLKGTEYLLNQSTTIHLPNYQPLFQDLIKSSSLDRESETYFEMNNISFSIVRNGQEYNRWDKWLPSMFSDVNAIMFVVDCSETCENLQESLNLFKKIWRNKALRNIPIILLLNKQDLLKDSVELNVYDFITFGTYIPPKRKSADEDDDEGYRKAKYFIKEMFLATTIEKTSSRRGQCHPYFINALDPESMAYVMNDYKNVYQIKVLSCYDLL